MARKSRKETVVLPAPEIDTTCRAGIYVRLSVEDKHTHTASIETQQLIIARYLEQNPEIIVVQTYIFALGSLRVGHEHLAADLYRFIGISATPSAL